MTRQCELTEPLNPRTSQSQPWPGRYVTWRHMRPYTETPGINWRYFFHLSLISGKRWIPYTVIETLRYIKFNVQNNFLHDRENYVIMDHFIESLNVYNIMKGNAGKRVKLRPDWAVMQGFCCRHRSLMIVKLTVCSCFSVSFFLGLSSLYWCTLWRTWGTCAMALLCSSLVRSRYHHWKYGIYCAAVKLTTILTAFSRCDRSIFSATFLQTTPGKNSPKSFLILLL